MTTLIEKSVVTKIFEKATKSCFNCQQYQEKMLPSYDCSVFLCKECAKTFLSIQNEVNKTGKCTIAKVEFRDPVNHEDYCNWHNGKISLFHSMIFMFHNSKEPPKCCTFCVQKAANL